MIVLNLRFYTRVLLNGVTYTVSRPCQGAQNLHKNCIT